MNIFGIKKQEDNNFKEDYEIRLQAIEAFEVFLKERNEQFYYCGQKFYAPISTSISCSIIGTPPIVIIPRILAIYNCANGQMEKCFYPNELSELIKQNPLPKKPEEVAKISEIQ